MSDQQSAISEQDAPVNKTLATLKAAIAHLPRPVDVHAVKPRIDNVEDADRAGLEIAWCNDVQEAVKAAASQWIKEITEQVAAALVFEENGELVPIKHRRKQLEDGVMKFGDKNRASLCQGKKKSVKLRHIEIKWRDGKDAVERIDDVEAKEVKSKIAELLIGDQHVTVELVVDGESIDLMEFPLAACLHRLLDLFGYCGAITVAPDVNKTTALAAHKNKQLTDEQLEAIDHKFTKGEEYITILPAPYLREGV